ncbi:Hsp20/alpha crystallin family protein [Alkalicoccobacillus murimartini]|uniref:HSP20 family molecular chaperone IbpA n=1 Tax=Alkalicoccobacillus murimartini TaxID=171685 RepID=A0ABT9YED1_9BACI|nr:Hsp20/alpha crystallin family protein [Alkalicoccobacillus murimartini]MDQ0206211.1 HSP20 family molecular chaperone IbpA [Alkalicoccobacillus murimartini]
MSDQKSNESKSSGYQDVMRSIDDFFHQTYRRFQPPPFFSQSIAIRTTDSEDAFIIHAELPGVDKQLIRIEALPHVLAIRTLSAESSEQSVERERLVSVPFVYNDSDIKANYENGLLRITINRHRQNITID